MEFPIVKIFRNCLVLVLALFLLSACNPKMNDHSERETAINARESELVTLFAELVEQKKALENNQTTNQEENSSPSRPTECLCDSMTDLNPAVNTQKDKTTVRYTRTVSGGIEKIHLAPDSRTLLGRIEKVYMDPPGMEFNARIDTGAQTSSLNAIDIVEFERDGKPHVRFNVINPKTGEKTEITRRLRRYARVKELNNKESQNRPVVRMRVVIADIDEQINFTLLERTMQTTLLSARNASTLATIRLVRDGGTCDQA